VVRLQRLGLMWLIHLVGDVHQPFHAVAEARGGNQIAVMYSGKPTNLHAVWDGDLVRQSRRPSVEYAAYLERAQLSGADLAVLTSGTIAEWALESRDLGLKAMVPQNAELGESYIAANQPIIEQQLALAGVRLAAILNDALK
jgi:hypothetical protein